MLNRVAAWLSERFEHGLRRGAVAVHGLAHEVAQRIVARGDERADHVAVRPDQRVAPVQGHRLGDFLGPVARIGHGEGGDHQHPGVLIDVQHLAVERRVQRDLDEGLGLELGDFPRHREVHVLLDEERQLQALVVLGAVVSQPNAAQRLGRVLLVGGDEHALEAQVLHHDAAAGAGQSLLLAVVGGVELAAVGVARIQRHRQRQRIDRGVIGALVEVHLRQQHMRRIQPVVQPRRALEMGLGIAVEVVVGVASAELVVHLVGFGIERDRALQRLDRLAVLALAVRRLGAEHQGVEVLRRQALGLARGIRGVVPALEMRQRARLGQAQLGVVGLQRHGFFQRRHRGRVAPGADLDLSQLTEHRGRRVGQRGRGGERVARLAVILEREVALGESGPGGALPGVEARGAREGDDRVLRIRLL